MSWPTASYVFEVVDVEVGQVPSVGGCSLVGMREVS